MNIVGKVIGLAPVSVVIKGSWIKAKSSLDTNQVSSRILEELFPAFFIAIHTSSSDTFIRKEILHNS